MFAYLGAEDQLGCLVFKIAQYRIGRIVDTGEQTAAQFDLVADIVNFAASGVFQAIDFDNAATEQYNVGGGITHSTSVNPERFTVAAGLNNQVVAVKANVRWESKGRRSPRGSI